MIKKLYILLFSTVCIFASQSSFAQTTTTIDYLDPNLSLSTSDCNLFDPSITIASKAHNSRAGGVVFSTNNGISLPITASGSGSGSTAFYINYLFQSGHKYDIVITAKSSNTSIKLNTSVVPNLNQFSTAGTSSCSLDGNVLGYSTVGIGQLSTNTTTSSANYTVPQFSGGSGYQHLVIWASVGTGPLITTLSISKIAITETPDVNFTVSPSSNSMQCGSTSAITFTANNVNNTQGVTNYTWNLGSNNGWQYNGSAAATSISTGTTNTISLTPTCGFALSSVGVTVTADNVTYNSSNAGSVTITQPSLSISGNSLICSGNSNYSISNLPCNATVSWQSSNTNVASVSASGNTATVTAVSDGSVTLTASVTVCNTTVNLTKQIGISIPTIYSASFANGVNSEAYFCNSHTGNEFTVELSHYPDNSTIEYRLLSYPSMTVVYTDPNPYSIGSPISVGSSFTAGWYILEIKVTTPCGSTSWTGYEVEFVNCSDLDSYCSDCWFELAASPNPADGDLSITIEKEKPEVKSLSKNEKVSYILYDLNRTQAVKQWTFDNSQNRRTLNVRGIKRGQYVLVVTKGKYRQSTRVIIK